MTLRERRISLGLGPVQAARVIGVSPRTLKRAEAGGPVHTASAKKIAEFYGLAGADYFALVDEITEVAA